MGSQAQAFAGIIAINLIVSVASVSEFAVYKELTRGYDKNVRPIHNTSLPTIVTTYLSYFILLSMDQPAETISFMTEIVMAWNDQIVKWNATAYADIDSVVVPASLLWKPDIIVTTSLQTDFMTPEAERYVIVTGDGTVTSGSPCIIDNQCKLNIQYFPYDIQECTVTLGSWMYDSSQIDLRIGNYSDQNNPDMRKGNGEWTMLSLEPVVNHYMMGDGTTWAELTYTVRLQRQPIYYTCVLLMPTFLCAFICSLGLFVPATNLGQRIEKVNMGLATLLAMAMILGIVANEMPKTTTLPLLGYYVLAELLLCTIGVVVSMIIMVAHQRALTRRYIPPRWLNAIILFKMTDSSEKSKVHPMYNTKTFYQENDKVKAIKVSTGYERLRQVMETIDEYMDRRAFEEDIELQWIVIFDRIDTYLLFVFNLVNLVMSGLILFK